MGLRPHLPSVEPKHTALAHPVTADLRAAGAIDETGSVDGAIVEWLTVLSRRDIALLVNFRLAADGEPARAARQVRAVVGGHQTLGKPGPNQRGGHHEQRGHGQRSAQPVDRTSLWRKRTREVTAGHAGRGRAARRCHRRGIVARVPGQARARGRPSAHAETGHRSRPLGPGLVRGAAVPGWTTDRRPAPTSTWAR